MCFLLLSLSGGQRTGKALDLRDQVLHTREEGVRLQVEHGHPPANRGWVEQVLVGKANEKLQQAGSCRHGKTVFLQAMPDSER